MSEEVWGGCAKILIGVIIGLVAATSVPGAAFAASSPTPCPLDSGVMGLTRGSSRLLAPPTPPGPLNPCPGGEWANVYGTAEAYPADQVRSVIQTSDGGYAFVGNTVSSAASDEIWFVRLNATGVVLWQKTYGGPMQDRGNTVRETGDGGFIVAGHIGLPGNCRSGPTHGNAWLLQLDPEGGIVWQKSYGGGSSVAKNDFAFDVAPLADGGYVVAGSRTSHLKGSCPLPDFWVFRVDSQGGVVWSRTYGGSNSDIATSVEPTSDGGFVVAGRSDIGSRGNANYDYRVIKLTSDGAIQWQKTYGGSGTEDGTADFSGLAGASPAIRSTADDGYVLAGQTYSFGAGSRDGWILRLDGSGAILWQQTVGGPNFDHFYGVIQTSDGGFAAAGVFNGTSNGSGSDLWLVKVAPGGTILWQRTYGGDAAEAMYGGDLVSRTADDGFILAGNTASFGGSNAGSLVLKLYKDGSPGLCPPGPGAGSTATVTPTTIAPGAPGLSSGTASVSVSATGAVPGNASAVTTSVCTS